MGTAMGTPVKRDAELQQEVIQELVWDSRVQATDVGVAVHDGIVTLTGTVESFAEKMAVEDAAHRVAGVLDVANDIVVRLPGFYARTDAEIADSVRLALNADPLIPHDQIRTTVSDGWITLQGTVTTVRQRLDSEHLIRHLSGVRGVTNALMVKTSEVDARQIRAEFEKALERQAIQEANRIQIAVQDGSIVLSGRVGSWAAKTAILGAASHTPGVGIVDRIVVDPLV